MTGKVGVPPWAAWLQGRHCSPRLTEFRGTPDSGWNMLSTFSQLLLNRL